MSSLNSTTQDYIEQYRIDDLLYHLSALLIRSRSENPEETILKELKSMDASGTHDAPARYPRGVSYTEEELRAVYEGLDNMRTGYVSGKDIGMALLSISSLDSMRLEVETMQIPENVDLELFMKLAHSILQPGSMSDHM
jgi:hypothetical protein